MYLQSEQFNRLNPMKKTTPFQSRRKLPVFILSLLVSCVEGNDCTETSFYHEPHFTEVLAPCGQRQSSPQPCISEFSTGLGTFFAASPYRQHRNYIYPIPLLNAENPYFYLHDVNAGLYAYKTEHHQLAIGVSYSYLYFDSDETDDIALKELNPRHSTLNADVTYTYLSKWGQTSIKMARDALGYNDGSSWDFSHQYPILHGPWFIAAGAGIHYESQKLTRYYYGISAREAAKTNLPSYHPDSSYSPYLSLDVARKVSRSWTAVLGLQVFFLDHAIKNSPMVDRCCTWTATAGMTYSF